MPEQVARFELSLFGGINQNDQANALVRRAFQSSQGQYSQIAPIESPSLNNIDFDSDGLSKRKGSVQQDDLTGVLVANEELIAGYWFKVPNSVEKPQVIVGKKSIYVNRTGTWAQVNNANGTAYTHNADVSKVKFAECDQRIFIGLDAENPIQVYSSGANLDDPLYAYSTGTTVNSSSSSGQPVLAVNSTTNLIPGIRVIIDKGNANEEFGYIASVSAGVSVTLEDNLTNTHGAGVTVAVENRYLVTGTSTYKEMTGNILTGNYLVRSISSKLVYSDGTVEFGVTPTPTGTTSGIWDVLNSTFYQASGPIKAITSFTPYYTNSLDENIYIGTTQGWEILTGFADSDSVIRIDGSRPVFNHQSYCTTKNWLVYLTSDKNVYAINGTTVLDLGRRAKTTSRDGVLDSMDLTNSEDSAFAYHYAFRDQVYIFFTTDSGYLNDTCLVIDFKILEPTLGTTQNEYEKYVRLIKWTITDPGTNKWFTQMYQNQSSTDSVTLGIGQSGYTYQIDSGLNDFGSVAISGEYYAPIFFSAEEMVSKQFLDIFFRGINLGDYDVFYSIYLDRSQVASITGSFNLGEDSSLYGTAMYDTGTYSQTQTVKGNSDIDVYREAIQWSISNDQLGETFLITSMGIRFMIGAEER